MVHLPSGLSSVHPVYTNATDRDRIVAQARLTDVAQRHRAPKQFAPSGAFCAEMRTFSATAPQQARPAHIDASPREMAASSSVCGDQADEEAFVGVAWRLYDASRRNVTEALVLAATSQDPNSA